MRKYCRRLAAIALAVHAAAFQIVLTRADVPPVFVPHPVISFNGGVLTKQLGDFGESLIAENLRLTGFGAVNGNVRGQGIDILAAKRSPEGLFVERRIIDVKTLTNGSHFSLNRTADGRQLSDPWIKVRLARIAREHPSHQAREMAVDFLKAMKRDPSSVSRQLHGVSIGSNRYFVREVNAAGGIGKTIAGGRLESLLNDIAMRSSSSEAKTTAVRHLAQFDQLSKATSQMSERGASAAALDRVRDHEASAVRKTLRPRTALKTGTLIVSNELEAKGWISRVARSPGVGMAALTFAFDEGFSGWQYYDGSIGSADFQRHTVQNGIKAAAFGSATQLVWILSPTPHGLVLIGVGIVAYVAADYAIGYYEANLESKAPMAYELRGIVDDKIINAPLIEEWATGKVRR